ncbi:hypothetical protein PV350_10895 [Streptomyces sp. PA03-6a]|nr:hypothetical protein [Streptomyces sp. PA03-6a]
MPEYPTGHRTAPSLTLSACTRSGLEHDTGFHQVHASDGARIRHRRVCEHEDVEVPQSGIACGWERSDGRTVVLLDEDLAALPLPIKRTVDVLGFVDERDVDPVLYSRPYWVGALLWPEEIREPDDLSLAAPVTERELELAELLMGQLAGVNIGELHESRGGA